MSESNLREVSPEGWQELATYARRLEAGMREGLERNAESEGWSLSNEMDQQLRHIRLIFRHEHHWHELRLADEGTAFRRTFYYENPEYADRPWFEECTAYANPDWRSDVLRDFVEFALGAGGYDAVFSVVAASMGRRAQVRSIADFSTFVRVDGDLDGMSFRMELNEKLFHRGYPTQLRDDIRAEFRKVLAAADQRGHD